MLSCQIGASVIRVGRDRQVVVPGKNAVHYKIICVNQSGNLASQTLTWNGTKQRTRIRLCEEIQIGY